MKRRNEDIRIAKGKIPNWMIAERLGIHENSFYRMMRHELPANKKAEIMAIIKELETEMMQQA